MQSWHDAKFLKKNFQQKSSVLFWLLQTMESKGLTLVTAHAPRGESIPFRSAGMSEKAS